MREQQEHQATNYYGDLWLGNQQIRRAAPVERPWERVPYTPFVQDSATSKEAAEAKVGKTAVGEQKVLKILAEEGPLTDEQITFGTGLNPSSARPRRVKLVEKGLVRLADNDGITSSGRRAARWEIAPPPPH